MASQVALDDLLSVTGGRLSAPSTTASFSTVAVDSRNVTPGSCFVALRGERVDGHDFAAEAIRAGAAVALVDRPMPELGATGAAIVVVDDPLTALQQLASWWRDRSSVRVVGITGSTGKTIAKELVANVLGQRRRVLRNEGNLNSETGLPMTLMQLQPDHEVAVLEMGMYTVGEIARLAEIACPEVGVVTAVHPTHLMRAGSIERVAEGKSELPRALPADGLAVLNADDLRVAAMTGLTAARSVTYGFSPEADVRAIDVESLGLGGTEFSIRAPWGERRLRSATPGRHLVPHALAAAAVGEWFAVDFDAVEEALAGPVRAAHRMALVEAAAGYTIVDDSYNASPVSVLAALDFLAETPVRKGGRRLAVLGDMLELGPEEEDAHRRVGARAAETVDGLVTVGSRGRWIADAARAAGLSAVSEADDAGFAVVTIERAMAPRSGDLVLVKASRGIALDRVVDALSSTAP